MTTISSASSASAYSSSPDTKKTAKEVMEKLLVSATMLASLDSADNSKKLTAQKTQATLWTLFDTDGKGGLEKSEVQTIVKNLGFTEKEAKAVWSQISPLGLNKITKANFDKNTFLKTTVDSNLATVQEKFSAYNKSPAGIAEKAMSSVLMSDSVLGALVSQTSVYVPPRTTQTLSTLWTLFNVRGGKTISEADVKTALLSEGGKASDAKAIWSQLSPKGAASINISQFISSSFLTSVMTVNKQSLETTVEAIHLTSGGGTSNSILSKFSKGATSITYGAASGYNDSPIGPGGPYVNRLNLFI